MYFMLSHALLFDGSLNGNTPLESLKQGGSFDAEGFGQRRQADQAAPKSVELLGAAQFGSSHSQSLFACQK